MPPLTGIFIIAEVAGPAAERIRAVHERFDPKLAAMSRPHLTIVGSSGAGPITARTPVAALRSALEPIAADTPPIALHFLPPMRFMQTEIVVLPLDPHGPLRALHERIKTSGLAYARPRFAFTPHVTLSFYPTLTPQRLRQLLSLRITEPAAITSLFVSETRDPLPPRKLFELRLEGRD